MNQAQIQYGHWRKQLDTNASSAIFHQWQQLELTGCIENFRIAAGESNAFREGWFFADSDAYKWLEAASCIWGDNHDPHLGELIDGFIALLGRAQSPDGYLFTYNQVHFPGLRWHNLQIEHELYCHGHLIEAGVTHHEVTGSMELFEIARRAANRICEDFAGKGPQFTPGHEEIEIALLRLHQAAPDGTRFLDQAVRFIENRGRTRFLALHLFTQNMDQARRATAVKARRQAYRRAHPGYTPYRLPPGNAPVRPPGSSLRWYSGTLTGRYMQQDKPALRRTAPVGHAVRFGYLQTAVAMLARLTGDQSALPMLEKTWQRMITRRMYVTGGLGSVPILEGFGRDFELDPGYAYAETCAAISSLLWNREMSLLTRQPGYADLFEWQLYNAASPGMGLDGTTWFYQNPLSSRGGYLRQPWFEVPCCPGNLSRTLAGLGQYLYSTAPGQLYIDQYVSSCAASMSIPLETGGSASISFRVDSGLPWDGTVRLVIIDLNTPSHGDSAQFTIHLRQPSWSPGMALSVNGQPHPLSLRPVMPFSEPAASGYDPRLAVYRSIDRTWSPGDRLEIQFEMPIVLRRASPRVKGHAGRAAVTRGPLVYCLETIDNPDIVDIFEVILCEPMAVEFDTLLLGGVNAIQAKTPAGSRLKFIPYYAWGNRGPSGMNVWIRSESRHG